MVRVRLYGLVLTLPLILVAIGFGLAFLTDGQISQTGILLAAAGFGLQVLFSLAFACPKCGKSPYALGPSVGPLSVAGKPWPDDKCSRCGHNFTAKE